MRNIKGVPSCLTSRVALFCLILIAVIPALSKGWPGSVNTNQEDINQSISATSIRIIDSKGRTRILLGMRDEIPVALFYGENAQRVPLAVFGDSDMPGIVFTGTDKKGFARLGLEHNGSSCLRMGRNETQRLITLGADSAARLCTLDLTCCGDKTAGLSLTISGNESPRISLKDMNGHAKTIRVSE